MDLGIKDHVALVTGGARGIGAGVCRGLAAEGARVIIWDRDLEPAEALAAEIAALPQLCLREDRMSALEQDGLDEEAALRNELRHAQISLAEAVSGAQRFTDGAGRHGAAAN